MNPNKTINNHIEEYWEEIFKIGKEKHNLAWKNMEYNYQSLMKSYLKGISAEDYVKKNLKKWKSNIKVIRS